MRLGLSRTRNRSLKGVGIFFTLFFLIFLCYNSGKFQNVFSGYQKMLLEYRNVAFLVLAVIIYQIRKDFRLQK